MKTALAILLATLLLGHLLGLSLAVHFVQAPQPAAPVQATPHSNNASWEQFASLADQINHLLENSPATGGNALAKLLKNVSFQVYLPAPSFCAAWLGTAPPPSIAGFAPYLCALPQPRAAQPKPPPEV